MKAYVMINTDIGQELNVVKALRNARPQSSTEYIRSADFTFGPYDVVATIEGADLAQLGGTVSRVIRTTPGVRETVTCVAIEVAPPAVAFSNSQDIMTPGISVG